MELPADVLIYNALLGIKGSKGRLVAVSPDGYYEAKLPFKDATHRLLLPIAETVIVFREPETDFAADMEIER